MMDQQKKMQIAIAVGVIALIAIAMFVTRDGSKMTDGNGPIDGVGSDIGPGAGGSGDVAVNGSGDIAVNGSGAAAAPRTAIINLNSTSTAKQSGTATLTDLGNNKTQIVIVLSNLNKDDTQPANIHAGTCKDSAKEPQYALTPVVKGRSVTVLNVNIGALIDKSPQSIRVRTDAVTPNAPYAACGELR